MNKKESTKQIEKYLDEMNGVPTLKSMLRVYTDDGDIRLWADLFNSIDSVSDKECNPDVAYKWLRTKNKSFTTGYIKGVIDTLSTEGLL